MPTGHRHSKYLGTPCLRVLRAAYGQLKKFMDAGFGKRVMFGSDQMVWPGLIEPSIDIIGRHRS